MFGGLDGLHVRFGHQCRNIKLARGRMDDHRTMRRSGISRDITALDRTMGEK
jgi:hypothetical protein